VDQEGQCLADRSEKRSDIVALPWYTYLHGPFTALTLIQIMMSPFMTLKSEIGKWAQRLCTQLSHEGKQRTRSYSKFILDSVQEIRSLLLTIIDHA